MAQVKSHVIQFVAELEETLLIIVTTSTENATGLVEGTELLWMRIYEKVLYTPVQRVFGYLLG